MSRQSMDQSSKWTRIANWAFALALVYCAMAMSAPLAFAQVIYGSLTGNIQDQSGAVIADAKVIVTNEATGATRETSTDSSGEYHVVNLAPGLYTLSIKASSAFASYVQKGVPIEVTREARVDVKLPAATVTTTVEVNSVLPVLQTDSSEVNHELTARQISELPITSSQGRNFQSLYTTIPGAAAVQEQNSIGGNPARAMSTNFNGVSYNTNTTRIDGAVNDYGWLPYLLAYLPPADAIQSVNIVTNSFNAEQGVAGGASIAITMKGGTNTYHGSGWWYYQDAAINARTYTATQASLVSAANPTGSVPKNVFNEFGFNFGGPVYIPKVYTGKNKLFFFENFERTTRRSLATPLATVPTVPMLTGDFSAVTSTTTLYDPQPGGVGPYLPFASRPTFLSEYGCNCIPLARQSSAAIKMLALLQPISATITPSASALAGQLVNDYTGIGTIGYNRTTNDAKITYNPSDRTTIFGRYSIEPYSLTDPQIFNQAGGSAVDGGQPGQASGRIQNVGLGASHVITHNLVADWDFGYTRQVTGAQSLIDIGVGNFGLNTLGIPGTNGVGPLYVGQPIFAFTGFSTLGNASGANPFLFRDNQFTTDVNLSWNKSRHSTKYGFTWYHFDLNHFQPSVGSGVSNPRGGFMFQGSMTNNSATASNTAYNALADFILGLPNFGTGIAVAKNSQLYNPNSLRWTEIAGYAQDQWTLTPKLTINYGIRYEIYPAPYTDKHGVFRLDPTLPQTANIVVGGVGGNPQNAGIDVGHGQFTPRLGVAYRLDERTVIRSGAGITTDPESYRFLRDQYPSEIAQAYVGTAAGTLSLDPNSNPITLTTGIPAVVTPAIVNGFTSLPVTIGTNTTPASPRRGYIESWNLFIQRDFGHAYVANIGYVGTHAVRQFSDITLNAAPLPSGATTCMPNGQYNPSSGLSGACSFNANQIINQQHCTATTGYVCYNTGGITMNEPIFSANYNALQAQLSRNAGRNYQYGVNYTWSHAFDDADNGAGSGSSGPAYAYPGYFGLNRSQSGYDRTHNLQVYGIYRLPFGANQPFLNQGIASAIFGGFQITGQLSHISGAPFTVSPSSSAINTPGAAEYAQLVAPYHQLGGHARTAQANGVAQTPVSGGMPWFDPTAFANPVEPQYTNPSGAGYVNCSVPSCMVSPNFGNTRRNEFRGPGVTNVNTSVARDFHVWRETVFQVRVEAFNVFNHAELVSNPNVTVGGGTFGYITSFALGNNAAPTRTLQFSGRINF
jgi:Carboxypeptidase regulatory-like domain/TonB dependent receptor